MKAYKKTPDPVPPPPSVVVLELTEDEYTALREGAYQVYYRWSTIPRPDDVWGVSSIKGKESIGDIGKRLYNDLPHVDGLRSE